MSGGTRTFRMRTRWQVVTLAGVLTVLLLYALWQRNGWVSLLSAVLLVVTLDGVLHGECVVDGTTLRVHWHRFRRDEVLPLKDIMSAEVWRGTVVVNYVDHRRGDDGSATPSSNSVVARRLSVCVRDAESFCAYIVKRIGEGMADE